jgi:hypothetical protein
MEALNKNSDEYKTLLNYAMKSQTKTHVKIEKIYKVQRKGEPERIAKWKHLDNHYLLWHGSDISNFMGILATGLYITTATLHKHQNNSMKKRRERERDLLSKIVFLFAHTKTM